MRIFQTQSICVFIPFEVTDNPYKNLDFTGIISVREKTRHETFPHMLAKQNGNKFLLNLPDLVLRLRIRKSLHLFVLSFVFVPSENQGRYFKYQPIMYQAGNTLGLGLCLGWVSFKISALIHYSLSTPSTFQNRFHTLVLKDVKECILFLGCCYKSTYT